MDSRRRVAVRLAAGAALLAALGCGGSDGPATYPVRGSVAYKGGGDAAKLAGYQVHFESTGTPKVTGSGEVGSDGTFGAACHLDGKDREGLPAGDYRVCLQPPRDGGDSPVRGGPLHPKYTTFDKSGLKVTVGTGSNAPTLEVEPAK
jgi:hypothetical protein